jgi:glycosyltransferase involved in cell wall biosynthesis
MSSLPTGEPAEPKGGITPDEGRLLSRLASAVRDGCIVEIGSFRGLSALALARGVREGKSASPIYCIEPHRPFVGLYGGVFGPADRGVFFETMAKTGAFKEVALINLRSEEVVPGWREEVGLLFVDGDHRYCAVRRDIELWDRFVRQGGIVALDDATDAKGGPIRVIDELIESGRYRKTDAVGKIVVLEKVARGACFSRVLPGRQYRILVPCHNLIPAGGLLRFDRVGSVLRDWEHDLRFVPLDPNFERGLPLNVPFLSLDEASEQSWDAVMVPGAGFPPETVSRLRVFQADNYGTRVQHVLNDQSKRARFLQVNASFAPHVVIFNNDSWPVGTFTDFQGDRFHVLVGAVDSNQFRPLPYRAHPLSPGKWVIGGLANKNPDLLISALKRMAPGAMLRLFGRDRPDLKKRYAELIASGQLELAGLLFGTDLQHFYETVDCIAMAEPAAGWSNLVAEAMAAGVPVVCTRHGTTAFARDGKSALLVEPDDPAHLATQLQKLRDDLELCRRLAIEARKTIEPFSWDAYARQLLMLILPDGRHHYIHAPGEGLFGKWAPQDRLQGLQPLLEKATGLTVLDLGAAEGIIAREFLKSGASLIRGFDLDSARVAVANSLAPGGPMQFHAADLSNWSSFEIAHQELLRHGFDVVLYLGLHQHLPADQRLAVLRGALRLAKRYFAFRAPAALSKSDRIETLVEEAGFRRLDIGSKDQNQSHLGPCQLFVRA